MLALANRFQEQLDLQAQSAENEHQADLLQSEIDHLSRLLTAYRSDPDFIQRVVEKDFGQQAFDTQAPAERVVLNLEPSLMFDAREFRQHVAKPSAPPWYASWVERLARTGDFRTRWQWTMIALFGLSFICLNEDFFQGRLGRTLIWATQVFRSRYRTD